MDVTRLTGFNKNAKTQNSLSSLLDNSIGILSEIKEVPRFPSDPNFFHYAGKACDTTALSGNTNFYNSGGASIHREAAVYKAIGEAIERYCSAIFDINDCPLSSYNEALFECVAPDEFNLYSSEQYANESFLFVPFTDHTPVRWTQAKDLVTNKDIYVPAAAVFMPYTYILGDGDSPILQPISTGLACHRSREEATISAICEVIERDAVMNVWQAMLSCPQVRIETLSDLNYEIVKRLEDNGSKVYMFDITMDHGITTILSVLSGENNTSLPAYVFSGAADPSPERAVRKSLEELPHTRRYCSRLMQYASVFEQHFPDHENVKDQEHHLHFYCDHNSKEYVKFLFQNKQRKSFDELNDFSAGGCRKSLSRVVEQVASTGQHIYLKELTTEDVERLGFYVVRAIIPGYQRLCMGYKNRTLGSKRMYEMAQQLNLKSHVSGNMTDNPAPHPYP